MAVGHVAAEKWASTVEWAHDELGFRWEEIGSALGTSGRTVQRWRDQDSTPSPEHAERIETLDRVRFWLGIVFEDDKDRMHRWLMRRLLDLQGRTPLEAMRAGEADRIAEFLASKYNGAFI